MAKKGRLSNDDFIMFKENIFLSDEELAEMLNRSVSYIEKTRKRVYPNKKTGRWNNQEVESLKANYDKDLGQLSRLLNRTEKAVSSKIESLKNKKDWPLTEEQVVEEFVEEYVEKFQEKFDSIETKEVEEELIGLVKEELEETVEEMKEDGLVEVKDDCSISCECCEEETTEETTEELNWFQKILKFMGLI